MTISSSQSPSATAPSTAPSTRERLIETAQRLLWDVGYEAMSPRRILDESGVGQGSLYHHFKGKQDLAHAALERIAEELSTQMEECLSTPSLPPLQRIDAWLCRPRQALKGCRLGRLTSEKAMDEGPINGPIATYFLRLHSALARTLREAKEQGSLYVNAQPDSLADTLIAIIQGGYVISRASHDPDALARAVDGARALLHLSEASPDAESEGPSGSSPRA